MTDSMNEPKADLDLLHAWAAWFRDRGSWLDGARGAHLTPGSRGGKAILEHLRNMPWGGENL
jgi:hypothetical protein